MITTKATPKLENNMSRKKLEFVRNRRRMGPQHARRNQGAWLHGGSPLRRWNTAAAQALPRSSVCEELAPTVKQGAQAVRRHQVTVWSPTYAGALNQIKTILTDLS